MDDEHVAHLERILANRRQRGVAAPAGAVALPQPSPRREQTPMPAPQPAATSPVTPVAALQQPTRRTNMMVHAPSEQRSLSATANSAEGAVTQLLLTRGTFDNFRRNPVLVTPNVKPYVKPQRPTSAGSVNAAGATLGSSSASKVPSVLVGTLFVAKNPFRIQDYDDFCVAPRYDPPVFVASGRPAAPHQQSTVDTNADTITMPPPLYDMGHCVQVLSQGDWFMKWTRAGVVHRRYVWLHLPRGVVCWAKGPDATFLLQSSIKLEDITDIQTQCVVDDASGRTFYKMAIVSLERALEIGTEIRDKFDVWFDTLQRIYGAQRQYMNSLLTRHATMDRAGPAAAQAMPSSAE